MSCAQHGFVVNELSQSHLHLWQCSSLQVRVRQCVSHTFIFLVELLMLACRVF